MQPGWASARNHANAVRTVKPLSNQVETHSYFCEEPWNGIFSVQVDGTARCCPCFAQVELGNIHESSIAELWNAEVLLEMREAFSKGELPEPCKGQLCPVVAGAR